MRCLLTARRSCNKASCSCCLHAYELSVILRGIEISEHHWLNGSLLNKVVLTMRENVSYAP